MLCFTLQTKTQKSDVRRQTKDVFKWAIKFATLQIFSVMSYKTPQQGSGAHHSVQTRDFIGSENGYVYTVTG